MNSLQSFFSPSSSSPVLLFIKLLGMASIININGVFGLILLAKLKERVNIAVILYTFYLAIRSALLDLRNFLDLRKMLVFGIEKQWWSGKFIQFLQVILKCSLQWTDTHKYTNIIHRQMCG